WNEVERVSFLNHLLNWRADIKNILNPLLLFQDLPSKADWEKVLGKPEAEDGEKLAKAISVTFWHQSQEATDCRWVKLLAIMLEGKLHFTSDKEDLVREIIEYPNYGNQKSVRPSIRACEMLYGEAGWSTKFWKDCFDKTPCMPEEAISKRL